MNIKLREIYLRFKREMKRHEVALEVIEADLDWYEKSEEQSKWNQ